MKKVPRQQQVAALPSKQGFQVKSRSTGNIEHVQGGHQSKNNNTNMEEYYNRVSTKTGGFEGSAPLHFDYYDDDETVQVTNRFSKSIHSSPDHFRNTITITNNNNKVSKNGSDSRNDWGGGGGNKQQKHKVPQGMSISTASSASNATKKHRNGLFHRWNNQATSSAVRSYMNEISNTESSNDESLGMQNYIMPKLLLPEEVQHTKKSQTLNDSNGAVASNGESILKDDGRQRRVKEGDDAPNNEPRRNCTGFSNQVRVRQMNKDEFEVVSVPEKSTTINSPVRPKPAVINDRVLMDDDFSNGSPGAIRLTAEGLKVHEEKHHRNLEKFRQSRSVPEKQDIQNNNKSPSRMRWLGDRRSNNSGSPSGPEKRRRSRSLIGMRRRREKKDDDIADFSLAPLNLMPDLETVAAKKGRGRPRTNSDPGIAPESYPKPKKNLFQMPFGRKDEKAVEILKKERSDAMETQRKQLLLEKQERERIERKRQAYLQVQRAREQQQPQNLSAQQRDTIFFSMEKYSDDEKPFSKTRTSKSKGSSSPGTVTTADSSSALPCCVICHEGKRSYIALPCMHFSYCEPCAMRLRRRHKPCQVCGRDRVSFAAVAL